MADMQPDTPVTMRMLHAFMQTTARGTGTLITLALEHVAPDAREAFLTKVQDVLESDYADDDIGVFLEVAITGIEETPPAGGYD